MADKNIKKSTIPKKNLPEFSGKTGKYDVRYRIISEDRNRTSHWSKVHSLAVPTVTQLSSTSYELVVEEINQPGSKKIHVAQLWWTPNSSYLFDTFDIYIATNKSVGEPVISDYSYNGRVSVPRFSINFDDDTMDNFSIIVHSPTYDKVINSNQILLKTPKHVV